MTYPDRCEAPVPKIDWAQARTWEFLPPDFDKFPLLRVAYQCLEAGGSATCTLNAADEIAVEAFLQGAIGFSGIYEVVSETLAKMPVRNAQTISDILEIDKASRTLAREVVTSRAAGAVAV
jgi:1-deoxy-D-xylulose-5-phosphate reductoisomerase